MWQFLRPILFSLDSERAHDLVLHSLARAPWLASKVDPGPTATCMGLDWRGRIGLAAGFDKNGHILPAVARMGFGSIEVGTVTPRPQPGNHRPRMWRLVESQSLFNRMGFNNRGAAHAA